MILFVYIFPSVFYPAFPELFLFHGNPMSVDPPLLRGNGGAVALANAFAMGCGEKLQTIILDENDIGAAGGSNMRFIWFTHDFLGRWKTSFLRVRPAGVGFGRLVLLKICFFVPKVLGGKDSNDSSYLHPNNSTHVETTWQWKEMTFSSIAWSSGWNYTSNREEFKMKPVSLGDGFFPENYL